MHIGM